MPWCLGWLLVILQTSCILSVLIVTVPCKVVLPAPLTTESAEHEPRTTHRVKKFSYISEIKLIKLMYWKAKHEQMESELM